MFEPVHEIEATSDPVFPSRQFTGAGSVVRLALCGVPDGRGGAEGLAPRILRHEPLHRVDPPHGRQPGKLENVEVVFFHNCGPGLR